MRLKKNVNRHIKWISLLISLLLILVMLSLRVGETSKPVELKAYSVIEAKDFRVTAQNLWDAETEKTYADVSWADVPNIHGKGYRMFQSEDGINWGLRSVKYGKQISVLNVVPNKSVYWNLYYWMRDLGLIDENGKNLIYVDIIEMEKFNEPGGVDKKLAPDRKDQFDVVMFGSADWGGADLSDYAYPYIKKWVDDGNGVLFGHDTILVNSGVDHSNYAKFADYLNIKLYNNIYGTDGTELRITNNGYMMKYPFEFEDNQKFTIPFSHTFNQSFEINKEGNALKWLEFDKAPAWGPADGRNNNYYLVTKNNVGMIQTGHSNGDSTEDERKIIANTLYNLAMNTADTDAADYSVKDDVKPDKATAKQKAGGTVADFTIELDAVDRGKLYQWYIEANTKQNGVKNSDIIQEEIISDIGGYLYKIDNSPTTEPAVQFDAMGRVSNFDIVVEPEVSTVGEIEHVNGLTDGEKWLHVVAADRYGNVADTLHIQIKDLMTHFRVTESYQDTDGQQLKAPTFTDVAKGDTYSNLAPTIADSQFVGYQIDSGTQQPGIVETPITIANVTTHHTVLYRYAKAIKFHLKQEILAKRGDLVIPVEGTIIAENVKTTNPTVKTKTIHLIANSGEQGSGVLFSPKAFIRTAAYNSASLRPIVPAYYRYVGAVVTNQAGVHNPALKVTTLPIVVDATTHQEFWITWYLEPSILGTNYPKEHSWGYGQEAEYGVIP